jgi:hypothetical protein
VSLRLAWAKGPVSKKKNKKTRMIWKHLIVFGDKNGELLGL